MPESTIDPPVKEPPVPTTPTVPPTEPDPPEPEPEEASALTFGQRLNAAATALRGRGTSAEIEQLRGHVFGLTAELSAAKIDIAAAKEILTKVTAERDAARKTVAEQEAAVTDFHKKVIDYSIDLVAEAHVPVAELPIAAASGGEDREDALHARLAKETDPKEKGKIAMELIKLRDAAKN